MSYYYNYYVGYEDNGKIYPWGPYTAKGKLKPIICKSCSFASNLHDDFFPVKEDAISDELRKEFEEFEYEDWNGKKCIDVKYLSVSELPTGSFIRKGYFLIDDVKSYEKNGSAFDLFYDYLTPEIYAAKLQNELMLGKNLPKKDCEGEDYTEPNASDYMYYAYPNYESKEYEAFLLRQIVYALEDYHLPKSAKYVILETEG